MDIASVLSHFLTSPSLVSLQSFSVISLSLSVHSLSFSWAISFSLSVNTLPTFSLSVCSLCLSCFILHSLSPLLSLSVLSLCLSTRFLAIVHYLSLSVHSLSLFLFVCSLSLFPSLSVYSLSYLSLTHSPSLSFSVSICSLTLFPLLTVSVFLSPRLYFRDCTCHSHVPLHCWLAESLKACSHQLKLLLMTATLSLSLTTDYTQHWAQVQTHHTRIHKYN